MTKEEGGAIIDEENMISAKKSVKKKDIREELSMEGRGIGGGGIVEILRVSIE